MASANVQPDLPNKPLKVLPSHVYGVRRNIESTDHISVPTQSLLPAEMERPLIFNIDKSAGKYLNLTLLKLHLRFRVKNRKEKEAKALEEAAKADKAKKVLSQGDVDVIIPGHPIQTLFSDCRLKLNDVLVSGSGGQYPIAASFLLRTCTPKLFRDYMEKGGRGNSTDVENLTSGAPGDGKGGQKTQFTDAKWDDFDVRSSLYSMDRTEYIDVTSYVIMDANSAPTPLILPDTVSVSLELVFNSPARALILGRTGLSHIDPVVEVAEARLSLPVHRARSNVPRSIRHQFMGLKVQPIILSKESSHYFGTPTYTKLLPARVSVLLTKMTTFDGDYKSSIYCSMPHNIESCIVYVGGVPLPSQAVSAKFNKGMVSEMYLRTAEALRLSLSRAGTEMPTLKDYKENSFILSTDLTNDISSGNTRWITPTSDGSLSLSLNFSKPLTEQLAALVIYETVRTLTIDSRGHVTIT